MATPEEGEEQCISFEEMGVTVRQGDPSDVSDVSDDDINVNGEEEADEGQRLPRGQGPLKSGRPANFAGNGSHMTETASLPAEKCGVRSERSHSYSGTASIKLD
ncbi:hypothetical protein BaRGS_00020403 [Batillaria attramentaria]|uniref:Uncharacterized protein n=1 Tax=Batillaria attramentaria TaxID=370345 RepID=A0ABD0KMI3_9CAEN